MKYQPHELVYNITNKNTHVYDTLCRNRKNNTRLSLQDTVNNVSVIVNNKTCQSLYDVLKTIDSNLNAFRRIPYTPEDIINALYSIILLTSHSIHVKTTELIYYLTKQLSNESTSNMFIRALYNYKGNNLIHSDLIQHFLLRDLTFYVTSIHYEPLTLGQFVANEKYQGYFGISHNYTINQCQAYGFPMLRLNRSSYTIKYLDYIIQQEHQNLMSRDLRMYGSKHVLFSHLKELYSKLPDTSYLHNLSNESVKHVETKYNTIMQEIEKYPNTVNLIQGMKNYDTRSFVVITMSKFMDLSLFHESLVATPMSYLEELELQLPLADSSQFTQVIQQDDRIIPLESIQGEVEIKRGRRQRGMNIIQSMFNRRRRRIRPEQHRQIDVATVYETDNTPIATTIRHNQDIHDRFN